MASSLLHVHVKPGISCCSRLWSAPPLRPQDHQSSMTLDVAAVSSSSAGPSNRSFSGIVETRGRNHVKVRVGGGGSAPGSFLSIEEAGIVEMSRLDMHEKFLCRLTVKYSEYQAAWEVFTLVGRPDIKGTKGKFEVIRALVVVDKPSEAFYLLNHVHRVIAEQEGVAVEELNAGKVCDWFQNDKAKRETDFESATLKWETSDW